MSQFDWDKLADGLSGEEARYALKLKQRLSGIETQKERQDQFIPFIKHMWPDFIEGEHHKIFAKQLEAVAQGKSKRLIVSFY